MSVLLDNNNITSNITIDFKTQYENNDIEDDDNTNKSKHLIIKNY